MVTFGDDTAWAAVLVPLTVVMVGMLDLNPALSSDIFHNPFLILKPSAFIFSALCKVLSIWIQTETAVSVRYLY